MSKKRCSYCGAPEKEFHLVDEHFVNVDSSGRRFIDLKTKRKPLSPHLEKKLNNSWIRYG